jgi:hypothetical protein
MKRLIIGTGVVVAALGAFIVCKGLTIQSQGTVSFGPIHRTVHEQHTVPVVLGGSRSSAVRWSPSPACVASHKARPRSAAGMRTRTPPSTPAAM